jgi:peptidoglycan hydrolase-like protein with peptidoglycan-binding domain
VKRAKGVALAVAVGALCTATWFAAKASESPDQIEARAKPPAGAPVYASLRMGQLEEPTSLTVTTRWERSDKVLAPFSEKSVVTDVAAKVGKSVEAGTVLLRANGRPVVILATPFPLYRNLLGGEEGDDVVALQQALAQAGLTVGGDRAGLFGPGTKRALGDLYERAGYPAPNQDGELRARVAELDAKITDAAPRDPADTAERQTLRARLGPQLDRSEIASTPVLPATVQEVVAVGASVEPGGVLAKLGAGRVVLGASLPPGTEVPVEQGAVGTFTDGAGRSQSATVTRVEEGADGATVIGFDARGQLAAGVSLVVQFDAPSGGPGEQLLAPAGAVVASGGRSYVFVRGTKGYRRVEVSVLGENGGTVAIESRDSDADLTADTEVRIGPS